MPHRDDDDYEPVFKKSNWGTNRYVYNLNNPVGMALTIVSIAFMLVMMFLMQERKGPFERPEETPWSPRIEQDPTLPWDEDTNATPSGSTTPPGSTTPSGSTTPPGSATSVPSPAP
ncbi:hypothetical protein [Streptomyces sp. BRA346]|uniref:hypothetical protein n=1 Tax=Streptomyces sp. BRA346 TaxID=2878199 RepID=UPI0040631FA9